MDDILIYSEDPEEHTSHVRQVLEKLREGMLFVQLQKCGFRLDAVDFLGFRIEIGGVSVDPHRILAIQEWPVPTSFRDIQVFIGFTNFYRGFIYLYSAVTAPITNLLKGMVKGKKTGPFEWTEEADGAFELLKDLFSSTPLLAHFDPSRLSKLEVDASVEAIGGIFSQLYEAEDGRSKGVWKPVAFYSKKLSKEQRNYPTADQEMLAIVQAFKEWRHYLEGPVEPVLVLSDHETLQSFMLTKELNRRQVRWAEYLAAYDFVIQYRRGRDNPADGLSRRPDLMTVTEPRGNPLRELILQRMVNTPFEDPSLLESASADAAFMATIGALTRSQVQRPQHPADSEFCTLVPGAGGAYNLPPPELNERSDTEFSAESEDDEPIGLVPEAVEKRIRDLQAEDEWCKARKWEASGGQILEGPERGRWSVDDQQLVRYGGAVYVPKDIPIRTEILRVNHDDPWQGGHFGVRRTAEVIRRFYWWTTLLKEVEEYVRTCDTCQRMKTPRHKPYGLLAALPRPDKPWQDITMDFITGLPPSKHRGRVYNAILNVVDRYSKMVRHILCTTETDAPELADLLIEEVFAKFGVPRSIVSDRGTTFTSKYWGSICYHLSIKRRFSTAYHPQTDGQTERMNQTLETYLRCYTNYEQNDWASLLASAEFVCNNSINTTTGVTPFSMIYTWKPSLRINIAPPEKGTHSELAQREMEKRAEVQEQVKDTWDAAQESIAKQYNKKHKLKTYKVGEQVLLSSKYIRTRRVSPKLSDRSLGPFKVVRKVGANAYQLDLPEKYGRMHHTFHVSLLEPYHTRDGRQTPEPLDIDGEEEWEVERILDREETRDGRERFLVRWKGFSPDDDSWEPAENLTHARREIERFRRIQSH
jgi:transposase InsO family protein